MLADYCWKSIQEVHDLKPNYFIYLFNIQINTTHKSHMNYTSEFANKH